MDDVMCHYLLDHHYHYHYHYYCHWMMMIPKVDDGVVTYPLMNQVVRYLQDLVMVHHFDYHHWLMMEVMFGRDDLKSSFDHLPLMMKVGR
jgi:hypothetical protein